MSRPAPLLHVLLALAIFDALMREGSHCALCGCTERQACPGGCAWVWEHESQNVGICSACVAEHPSEVRAFFEEVEHEN